MARVLAPGGRLAIVTTPPEQAAALKRYFGPVASRMRLDAPEVLGDWLRAAGLVPGAVRPVRAVGYLITARKPVMPATTGAVIEIPGFHGRITGRIGDLLVVEAEVTGAIQAHTAQGTELVVVLSGELHARVDGTERVLRQGDHALIPAGTTHEATVAGPTRLLLIGPPE
jgi:quercetin dioxygenase-like cupin family protein